MNPVTSLWYGVDMLAEKYTASGSYVCCIENPVKFIDINGNEWGEKTNENGENIIYANVELQVSEEIDKKLK